MSRSWQRADNNGYKNWGRVRKARVYRDDWKKEVEQAMALDKVFVVMNEWQDHTNGSGGEIVGSKFYRDIESALEDLRDLATRKGLVLEDDEAGFTLEDQGHISFEEYYVLELEEN